MNSTSAHADRRSVLISAVTDDGAIVETIFDPVGAKTAFVVARGENVEVVPEVILSETKFVPMRPTNNLLRHNALLLPSGPDDFESIEELLSEIEAHIRQYVSMSEQACGIAAGYVLLSWVYDAFNEVPYLRFRGDYGTGKTRALLVIGSLCHKVFFASGASTISPIFHTLDTFKGTLIFDEADFRFSDEKSELVKILNNGNVKGFPVLRTEVKPNKEFDPRAFAIFGPKIVGMRRSYEDRALESRFLTVEMEPGHATGVPINLPDTQKEEALALRNKLLTYRLRNRLTVLLDAGLADPNVEPRLNQILLPLLSVVPDDHRRWLIRQSARTIQAGILSARSASIDGQLVAVMRRLLIEGRDTPLSLSEIAASFASDYGAEYERPVANRQIGAVLRRLGIVLYKSNGVFVLAPAQQERLSRLCERYGLAEANGEEMATGDCAA